MHPRYIVFAPSYTPDAGGIIVLHKLCHLINSAGFDAFIYPWFPQFKINKKDCSDLLMLARNIVGSMFRKYKTNLSFNTPLFAGDIEDSDIVIYPEIVFGNPLKAKHVVRWLLNKPGHFTGDIYYGPHELYFKFDHGLVDDFCFYNSKLSDVLLNVWHVPCEIYNESGVSLNRAGTAYSIRKGTNKPHDCHPDDAILIDGMSHESIAEVFKKVKQFISYDTYSAYSTFAVMCGCESIVVPDEGKSKHEWYPDVVKRYGLAYGFDDLDFARNTRKLKLEHISSMEKSNTASVISFINETMDYFK